MSDEERVAYIKNALADVQYDHIEAVTSHFGYATVQVWDQPTEDRKIKKKSKPTESNMILMKILMKLDEVIGTECTDKVMTSKNVGQFDREDFMKAINPQEILPKDVIEKEKNDKKRAKFDIEQDESLTEEEKKAKIKELKNELKEAEKIKIAEKEERRRKGARKNDEL